MKTLIIVRAPSKSGKTYFRARAQSLAKAVAKECDSFRYAPTMVYTGQDPDLTVQIMEVNNAIHPRYVHCDTLLDCEYRATEIQHLVFNFLSVNFQKTDVMIVGAVPNIALYCLDYAKCEMKGVINHEYIQQGEALMWIENLGSKRIIPEFIPHLRIVQR